MGAEADILWIEHGWRSEAPEQVLLCLAAGKFSRSAVNDGLRDQNLARRSGRLRPCGGV
jgi:hypothetical protein